MTENKVVFNTDFTGRLYTVLSKFSLLCLFLKVSINCKPWRLVKEYLLLNKILSSTLLPNIMNQLVKAFRYGDNFK